MIDCRTVAMACLAGTLLLSTGACSNVRETLGLNKRAPDEFTVMRKPPLVIPPNFSLRPPVAGGIDNGESESAAKARAAILGQAEGVSSATQAPASQATAKSIGEQALLLRAGAEKANPGIRQLIRRETTLLEEKDASFTERLIFWRKSPPPGQVIDAKKEAERLRQAAATGKSPTGDETPVIQRRKRAILEDIF